MNLSFPPQDPRPNTPARLLTYPKLKSKLLRPIFAVLALSTTLAAQSPHKLVVLSIDGLDARFINDPALKVKIPNIRKLIRTGAFATVVGVAPSENWPSHASLVTGVSPSQHGITQPSFAASAFHATTLWDVATKAGLKAATIFWPATLGANVAFDFPEFWETRRGNTVQVDPIAQKSTPAGITGRVGKMFPAFDKDLWDDSSSALAAAWLLATEKPDLLLVHMGDVDAEQHETMARSIYAREILESDDDLIGQIIAKLPPGAIFALVSDHGFENNARVVRPRVLLKQAGINGRVEVEDGLIGTPDKAVAQHLRTLIGGGRKTGIAREVPMAEVRAKAPALGRWIAAFDTIPDFTASLEDHGTAIGNGTHLGVGGWWPTHPGYRSVFILSGEGVRAVKLGEIDMLQIAPTFADVLGVKLPAAKYSSLWHSISK